MAITLPPWDELCELVMRVSEDVHFSRVKEVMTLIEMEANKLKAEAAARKKKEQKKKNKNKNKNNQ